MSRVCSQQNPWRVPEFAVGKAAMVERPRRVRGPGPWHRLSKSCLLSCDPPNGSSLFGRSRMMWMRLPRLCRNRPLGRWVSHERTSATPRRRIPPRLYPLSDGALRPDGSLSPSSVAFGSSSVVAEVGWSVRGCLRPVPGVGYGSGSRCRPVLPVCGSPRSSPLPSVLCSACTG